MSYHATVYRVMIASPSDVAKETSIIRDVLAEWNAVNSDHRAVVLLPRSSDTHATPTMGERPQSVVNREVLRGSDLLIGVFWTRIGTSTENHVSGSVEVIEEHLALNRPTMLYFSAAPVRPDSVDPEQYSELSRFKDSCKSRGYFESYENLQEFRDKLYRQLQLKLNNDEYFSPAQTRVTQEPPVPSGAPPLPSLSSEAQQLLIEAIQDPEGYIMHLAHTAGVVIQTNRHNFLPDSGATARELAIWESAIHELERENLIEASSYERNSFSVTRRGYEIGEILRETLA